MTISYRIQNKNPYTGSIGVAAVSDKVESRPHWSSDQPIREVPYGYVKVKPPAEHPNFDHYSRRAEDGSDISFYGHSYQFSDQAMNSDPPKELFTHTSPQIAEAFVDPTMRSALPTMVGLAMRAHHAGGDLPMADTSLTRFSSALSKNAVDRGLAKPHPLHPSMSDNSGNDDDDDEPMERNRANVDWVDMDYGNMHGYQHVPDSEVHAARQWVRSRIAQSKVKRGESQFTGDIPSESQSEWASGGIKPGTGQGSLF